jgi:hypothetical protein
MRRLCRVTAAMCLTLSLLPALASPALAANQISYRGRTSAPPENRIRLRVLKKDNGRRFLNRAFIDLTLICEDATTEDWSIGFGWGGRGEPIQSDGQFSLQYDFGSDFFGLEGDINFGRASGTFEFAQARLTEDHMDSQVCTTGELTWTADRKGSRPARPTAADVPEGTGVMRLRVTDGVAEVVKLVEPSAPSA